MYLHPLTDVLPAQPVFKLIMVCLRTLQYLGRECNRSAIEFAHSP